MGGVAPVEAARYRPAVTALRDLPLFGNGHACARCQATYEIRVHFCRCDTWQGADHYHRICTRCGHEWPERCPDDAYLDGELDAD